MFTFLEISEEISETSEKTAFELISKNHTNQGKHL